MKLSERQKQIVDESIKLIANSGIQSLTIKNISQAIGVSEPAIYRHFKSKFDIIMAVLSSFETISEFVFTDVGKEELSSIGKIKKFLFDRYERFVQNPEMAKVMFSEAVFEDDPKYSEKMLSIMHQHGMKMRTIIVEGQNKNEIRKDIDAKELFRIIFGSMRLLVTQWCLSNFNFDLIQEGSQLWESVKQLIRVE